MSRYKIATKTDKLRYQIAKEVFGEIEDSDGVRDIPSWEIFEKCLEQHKRIQELEAENCLVRNTKINTNKMECINLQAEILELQEELSLTEKALELACLYIFENEFDESADKESCIKDMIDVFKTKAKEMKSEIK